MPSSMTMTHEFIATLTGQADHAHDIVIFNICEHYQTSQAGSRLKFLIPLESRGTGFEDLAIWHLMLRKLLWFGVSQNLFPLKTRLLDWKSSTSSSSSLTGILVSQVLQNKWISSWDSCECISDWNNKPSNIDHFPGSMLVSISTTLVPIALSCVMALVCRLSRDQLLSISPTILLPQC